MSHSPRLVALVARQLVTGDELPPAVSVHVHAPSLREMTDDERRGGLLYSSRTELAGVNW